VWEIVCLLGAVQGVDEINCSGPPSAWDGDRQERHIYSYCVIHTQGATIEHFYPILIIVQRVHMYTRAPRPQQVPRISSPRLSSIGPIRDLTCRRSTTFRLSIDLGGSIATSDPSEVVSPTPDPIDTHPGFATATVSRELPGSK